MLDRRHGLVTAVLAGALAGCATLLVAGGDDGEDPRADAAVPDEAPGGDAFADVADDYAPGASDAGLKTKLVFVSSVLTGGDMRFGGLRAPGVTGANDRCTTDALAAGLPGIFVAWLSTTATHAIALLSDGSWRLPATAGSSAGPRVFASKAAIAAGPLLPINRGAAGTAILPAETVWTGTTSAGLRIPDNMCEDWTTAGGGIVQGVHGNVDSTTLWTHDPVVTNCDTPRHVYCFEK